MTTCQLLALSFMVLIGSGRLQGEELDPPGIAQARHVFKASQLSIEQVLSRPYDRDVPMGCTGERVWASSPRGWAFRDDVHWLYLTNLRAFDIEIRDEHSLLIPAKPTYFPSHIHSEGVLRKELTASATFTFPLDNVENPLTEPFDPRKRWTCWSSGRREDGYTLEFATPRTLTGFDLFFFDDAPTGECRPPASVELHADDGTKGVQDGKPDAFVPIHLTKVFPDQPRAGENRIRFEPVRSTRFRLWFHHAGQRFYTGIYGLKPIYGEPKHPDSPSSPLRFTGDKFITADDVLVSVIRVHNPTDRVETIYVDPIIHPASTIQHESVGSVSGIVVFNGREVSGREPRSLSLDGRQKLQGEVVDFRFRYAVLDDPPRTLRVGFDRSARGVPFHGFTKPLLNGSSGLFRLHGHHIQPGRTKVFKAALELRPTSEPSRIDSVLEATSFHNAIIRPDDQDSRDLVAAQIKAYQSWFDVNVPDFDCSDPWVRKMYAHRAYVLRKNMLDPKLGRMRWPTQSEGRWRSPWYPNVISYGAAHQIREARWLRDPKYWEGHLRTWAENAKPDGVYPSHVTLRGPSDGQYTDWITSTAWDGHLVHPNKSFLSQVVDKLAANVRAWQKVYDPDGDGLLRVNSHWWTGMEYQPSFFAFSDYRPSQDFYQPARPVSLERVDLTAYNYGNAISVARIYRLLGQPGKAKEFDELASRIAGAVMTKMWRPEKRFFYSLRADDDAVADVKEVIGVYPFYFGMVPWGKGHESAWASILDPKQFWTTWPVASASKECPAYSQTNWPGDGRAAGCMWNGPTWPHANSLVMTAMARTLRATRDRSISDSPLEKEHLWALFLSFTKAQYRNQDIAQPWTGEFYNGDTGQWKTAERDYNHSTWLDILIPELIGVVPRDDDVLEIDPLLPDDALSFFLLDGVLYHGHDVTVVWDAPAAGSPDRYSDGRKGLDVYVNGRLVASAPRLSKLRVDLE